MPERHPHVVNIDEVPEQSRTLGEHWGASFRPLTPAMPASGHLRVNHMRVPPGRSAVPFHAHRLEDEVFFVLSGTGVLRYGDARVPIGLPLFMQPAHQLGVADESVCVGDEQQ